MLKHEHRLKLPRKPTTKQLRLKLPRKLKPRLSHIDFQKANDGEDQDGIMDEVVQRSDFELADALSDLKPVLEEFNTFLNMDDPKKPPATHVCAAVMLNAAVVYIVSDLGQCQTFNEV